MQIPTVASSRLPAATESTSVQSRQRYIEIKVLAYEKNLCFQRKLLNSASSADATQGRQVDVH
jgi:hypothetical protein